MSDHAAAAHLETSTGLDSRKLAIWTFIGSECMFFATLISNYLVHKETWLPGPGPFPHEVWKSPSGQVFEPIIEIPLVTLGTALLLFSSLFVVLALANAQRGNRRGLLGWLGATMLCGFFFVGMQVYEFTHFVHKGLTLKTNLFGASFFTLTGFHGTHVTLGRDLAAHALDRGVPRQDPAGEVAQPRDRRAVLALRGRGLDRDLPRRLPDQVGDSHGRPRFSAAAEHSPPDARACTSRSALVLFVLTALEVGLYEITYGEHSGATGHALQPFFVPLLLVLSALKFALVAMFYMHLKQDSRLFTGVFVFPLIIATVIILALIVLEAYHFAFATVRVILLPFAPLLDERPRPTGPYEWAWSLHPSVLLGTGLLGALYFYGIGPWRRAAGPAARAALEGGLLLSRRCSCCSARSTGRCTT